MGLLNGGSGSCTAEPPASRWRSASPLVGDNYILVMVRAFAPRLDVIDSVQSKTCSETQGGYIGAPFVTTVMAGVSAVGLP